MTSQLTPRSLLRIRFSKIGKIRFIGHRDVARAVERAVRRVGLPVVYSAGFSPRMKLSFGLALPTGYESVAEYLELPLEGVDLEAGTNDTALVGPKIVCSGVDHQPCEQCSLPGGSQRGMPYYCTIAAALSDALPVGMDACAAVLTARGGPSLQSAVSSCGWQFEIAGLCPSDAESAVEKFCAASAVMASRVHKGRTVSSDIRPSVAALRVEGPGGDDTDWDTYRDPHGGADQGTRFWAELSAKPRVVRPSEVAQALAPAHEMGIARRTHQWTNGAVPRAEPVSLAACTPSRCVNAITQQ